ncbi:hypothetical protein Tco_1555011 [Tanacetum coccineum]|uniref:Uncharacterized protein n=1 Tax=Tanacetum coccineum TaxID=301880 RepID=A0ABQ5B8V3_9ASTR
MELVGFSEEQLIPVGKVELEVACGFEGLYRRTMKFTTCDVSDVKKGKFQWIISGNNGKEKGPSKEDEISGRYAVPQNPEK